MPLVYAVSSSLWSLGSTWNSGTVPTASDDVFANAKTVIVDQNANIRTLRNVASGSAVAGGGFIVSGSFNITTTGGGFFPISTGQLLQCSGSGTITLTGDVRSPIGNSTNCINMLGSGTLNIVGNIYITQGDYSSHGIYIASPCTLNVIGDVWGGPNGNIGGYPIRTGPLSGGYIITITGNLYQDFLNNNTTMFELSNSGSINVTGNLIPVRAASTQAFILLQYAGSRVIFTGNILAASPSPTVSPIFATFTSQSVDLTGNIFTPTGVSAVTVLSSTSNLILRGTNLVNSFQNPGFSRPAVFSPCITIVPSNQFRWTFYNAPSSSLNSTMFVQGYLPDSPSQANVRFGTTYLNGTLSGSIQMPQPSQVISGVKTDNTTGSYNVTVETLTEAVWSKLTSTLTGSNTIGERLKNNSTIDSTGQQLQALI